MSVLNGLEPREVFRYFEEICQIPHGSGNTKAISDYLKEFAVAHHLKYRQDEYNNVIIWKDAAPGYESCPTVMLQGHMDMVCEKEDGCEKDMETEGLDLFVDGDMIGARGTTLGGDDGVAVAMALAVLDQDDICHGPLECVFTVDEEVGLKGALGLDTSDLKAAYMINIDSEKDRVLTVSCAGSIRAFFRFPRQQEQFEGKALTISVDGLQGGHSGEEIHLGRANANVLLGRLLYEISEVTDLRIAEIQGGTKENAIPRSAGARILVADAQKAIQVVKQKTAEIKNEFYSTDKDIQIAIEIGAQIDRQTEKQTDIQTGMQEGVQVDAQTRQPVSAPEAETVRETVFDRSLTERLICFLFCAPNGVQVMSADVPGLVQTSLNIGRIYEEEEAVVCSAMLRSSVNSQNQEILAKLRALCKSLGATVSVGSAYSAWEYRPVSPLRDTMTKAFREVYGEEPKIEALHAGLECGILSGKMPQLDCISIGPDLPNIHTPRERLYIQSTGRIWRLLLETLKQLTE